MEGSRFWEVREKVKKDHGRFDDLESGDARLETIL